MSKLSFSSLRLEQNLIGGLLKYPALFFELDADIDDRVFKEKNHRTIFGAVKSLTEQQKGISPAAVGGYCKNLGIQIPGGLDIIDYLESLKERDFKRKDVLEAAIELRKYQIAREIYLGGDEVKKEVQDSLNGSISDIITIPDRVFSERTNYHSDNEPRPFFEGVVESIQEKGNNPQEEVGLKTPYPTFQKWYGGWRDGGLVIFASLKKSGKTTLLADIALKTPLCNEKCRTLFIDSEMSRNEIGERSVASFVNIGSWYIETGMYAKNKKYKELVEQKAFKEVERQKDNVDYIQVGNMNLDKILSVIRRWCKKQKNNGFKPFVVFDWLKRNDALSANMPEWMLMGDYANKLKQLAGEMETCIVCASQVNEEGKLAISARMSWFCTSLIFWRKKTEDEIQEDGIDAGTHAMQPTEVSRFLGRDSRDMFSRFKDSQGQWRDNYISFRVENFAVQEIGDLGGIQEEDVSFGGKQDDNEDPF